MVVTLRAGGRASHRRARSRGAGDGRAPPRRAGVPIVGGDTKVVEHGKADHMYITTTGVGRLMPGVALDPRSVRPGDRILLSGPIGDHGITILLARGELDLEADLRSDTRSVLPLVERARRRRRARRPLDARPDAGRRRHVAQRARPRLGPRHPHRRRTRSRCATRCAGACELLGLDPLHIANEGQFLAVVAPEQADAALAALRAAPGGERGAR